MMDYYEELGVDRSASPEEIRQAYRHLVRLLHPDHCSDAAARPLADLQMKRLNEVLRILTNPAERAGYDQAVFGSGLTRFRALLPGSPTRGTTWFWVCFGAAGVFAAIFLLVSAPRASAPTLTLADQPPRGRAATLKRVGPTSAAGMHTQATSLPLAAQGGTVAIQPEPFISAAAASPVPTSPPTTSPPIGPEEEAPIIIPSPSPSGSLDQILGSLGPARSPPAQGFGGVWLLAPANPSKASGSYSPEYIELRLNESSGMLRGRYMARYRIPDQAISPEVSFQFSGKSGTDRAVLPWTGAGGAKGEVELHLLTSGWLEVTWVANQLGGELGLISGTATLVRKID